MRLLLPARQGLPAASVNLEPRHVYGLVGRSGVGKTRLLRGLAAARWPDAAIHLVTLVDQESGAELAEEEASAYDLAMMADVLGDCYAGTLKGLGFTPDLLHKPASALSGGWRQRLSVALALLRNPDVLLGDEITNGLDLAGLDFLERQLALLARNAVIVLTSHDRAFLSNLCTDILYFDDNDKTLRHFPAGFDEYELRCQQQEAAEHSRFVAADKQRKAAAEFIQETRAKAAREADPNKQRQAREKLDKMERIGNFRSDGRRYRINKLKKLDAKWSRAPQHVPLHLGPPARELRFNFEALGRVAPDPARKDVALLALDDVALGYDADQPPVLRDVSCSVFPASRVALVGLNGQGKSTLLRALAQDASGGPKVLRGDVRRAAKLRVAAASQGAIDELAAQCGDATTPVDFLLQGVLKGRTEHEARSALGRFGLGGDVALKPVKWLSGGQKMRLVLAASFSADEAPSLLVLDEPTQHLDLDAIRALSHGLNEYKGALIVASHDRRFLQECRFDQVWKVQAGKVTVVHVSPATDGDADDADEAAAEEVQRVYMSLLEDERPGE